MPQRLAVLQERLLVLIAGISNHLKISNEKIEILYNKTAPMSRNSDKNRGVQRQQRRSGC